MGDILGPMRKLRDHAGFRKVLGNAGPTKYGDVLAALDD